MTRLFGNLSVAIKVMAVPAGLVAVMAGLGVYAFVLLGGNEAEMRQLETGALQQSMKLGDFETGLWTLAAKLYRLTSTAANETDTAKIERMAKALLAESATFAEGFAGTRDAVAASGWPGPRVQAFEAAFAAYIKQVRSVIDMAETDSGSALLFMAGAERRFAELEKMLAEAEQHMSEIRSAALYGIYTEMTAGRTVFAGATGAASLIAFLLALLICRLISRPVVALTDAVSRIAQKEYNLALPALDQRDEIGRMAKAVEVLKRRSERADR